MTVIRGLGRPLAVSVAAFAVVLAAGSASAEEFATPVDPVKLNPQFKVVDGSQVDANTFEGWKTWRSMACERCHGANQEGLVGPSLVDDLKTLSVADFKACVLNGRIEKGMPNFGTTEKVVKNIDNLYAFLKGRSDGTIATGHLKKLPE